MARALYKDGKVVILDEPTAALDALAEDRMYREFENMIYGKTAVLFHTDLEVQGSATRLQCLKMEQLLRKELTKN